jgi:hypothetical protein
VDGAPSVYTTIGESVDGMRGDGHDEGVQDAPPPEVAKVMDPRISPVFMLARPLEFRCSLVLKLKQVDDQVLRS